MRKITDEELEGRVRAVAGPSPAQSAHVAAAIVTASHDPAVVARADHTIDVEGLRTANDLGLAFGR